MSGRERIKLLTTAQEKDSDDCEAVARRLARYLVGRFWHEAQAVLFDESQDFTLSDKKACFLPEPVCPGYVACDCGLGSSQ